MVNTLRYVAALAAVATTSPALAQSYSPELTARCHQAVAQMKFEGWPAERNADMMLRTCLANGGTIPGAAEEKPAALPRNGSAQHQRSSRSSTTGTHTAAPSAKDTR